MSEALVPLIAASGFREYDVRWRYREHVDAAGVTLLGRGLATQMFERDLGPQIVVGHDLRSYSPEVANALMLGLIQGGAQVRDIGLALTPMAYFTQFHLGGLPVAMVTASHNPNGWTGVKMGLVPPLTHGSEDMARLRDIVLGDAVRLRGGGSYSRVDGIRAAYLDDLAGDFRMTRRLRVVCATGNGTAGAFVPELLERIGVEVIPRHTRLDPRFPHYNPNPEALEMLHDMGAAVRESGADLAFGFDGDGDRCGVVDGAGEEIFADKLGVVLARDLAQRHPGAVFLADVKSTGLFASDPELRALGARSEYGKTGHSHMKRRLREIQALAGFEKSGHFFFAPPIGRGYDCGLRVALEVCKLLERNPGHSLAALIGALPRTWSSPTLSPACAEEEKYPVVARLTARLERLAAKGERLAGQRVVEVLTINGARTVLESGAWCLVRASSNTPNLVVVCESPNSASELRAVFEAFDGLIREEPAVGTYDQHF